MKKRTYLTIPALLAVSMAANAQFVDLFTEAQSAADATNGDGAVTSSTSTGIASILGGQRDISAEAISGANDADGGGCNTIDDLCSVVSINGGFLNFSNDTSGAGGVVGEGIVQWDGADQDIALDVDGLASTDLTDGGLYNAFTYDVLFSDQGWEFELALYSDANNFTIVQIEAIGTDEDGDGVHVPYSEEIFFANLENAALCGLGSGVIEGIVSVTCGNANTQPVDMSSLGAFQLTFNNAADGRTSAVDFTIGPILTVPEPGPLGLMGMAMLIAGMARYRQHKKG